MTSINIFSVTITLCIHRVTRPIDTKSRASLASNFLRTALPPHNSGDSSIMTKNQAISLIDGYQQALEDFAIPNLLTRLKTYSDTDFDAVWMNLTQPESC